MAKLIMFCSVLIGLPFGAMVKSPSSSVSCKKITKQQVIICAPSVQAQKISEDESPAPPNPSPSPEPEVMKITAPAVVEGFVGEFVEVEVDTNTKKANFFGMDRGLATFPNRQRPLPKATVVMAQKPGDYRIAAYTARGDEPSDPIVFTIRMKKHPDDSADPVDPVTPQPPKPVDPVTPKPVDPVTPEPVKPNIPLGVYGLAQVTYDAVMSGVSADKRLPAAKKISDNYALVVAQIAAGTTKTVKDADAALKTGNRAAVPVADVALWSPVFAVIATKINGLKLTTLSQWQQAFMEIGLGFSVVQ